MDINLAAWRIAKILQVSAANFLIVDKATIPLSYIVYQLCSYHTVLLALLVSGAVR